MAAASCSLRDAVMSASEDGDSALPVVSASEGSDWPDGVEPKFADDPRLKGGTAKASVLRDCWIHFAIELCTCGRKYITMQDFTANSYKIENFYANGGTRGYYEAQSATEVKCTGRLATPGEPSLPPTPGSMLYGGASQLRLRSVQH